MNFDNMEPDYNKDNETDLQKMARQTNKNVFLAVTAGVFISLGFAAVIFIVFLNLGFITLNKFNADGTRRDTDGTAKLSEIQSKMSDFYFSDKVNQQALMDGMYKGYVAAYGDPYTSYYTADEYSKLISSYEGKIGGIGVRVSYTKGEGLNVSGTEDGSPAAAAGIRQGDVITAIDGKDITNLDSNPVNGLRGEVGSEVSVTYNRDGASNTVKLKRVELQSKSSAGTMLDGTTIGYVALNHFEEPTPEQFNNAVSDLESKGMTGLIIDLRNNTGGLVASAVKVLDRLLPVGVYGTQVFKNGSTVELSGTGDDSVNVPIVLLVNGDTASSAEIMTAAMKDLGKAKIVGTKTFGKGITQKIEQLSDGSGLTYTDAELRSPNGTTWHGTGITPDVVVEYDENAGTDTQLKAAMDLLK